MYFHISVNGCLAFLFSNLLSEKVVSHGCAYYLANKKLTLTISQLTKNLLLCLLITFNNTMGLYLIFIYYLLFICKKKINTIAKGLYLTNRHELLSSLKICATFF
jgi:hypothetical protein